MPASLLQWEMDSRTSVLSIKLDVVASDDVVWSMKCEGGAIVSDERKMGNKNYKMLSSRVKVPETDLSAGGGRGIPWHRVEPDAIFAELERKPLFHLYVPDLRRT